MGYIKKCPKCDSINNFTKVKGTNTGLYCKDCGTWIKKLNKDEIILYEENLIEIVEWRKSIEDLEKLETSSNSIYFEKNIVKLIEDIDKKIKNEIDAILTLDITNMGIVRKLSYCRGLNATRHSLEDILNNYKKE